MNKQSENLTGTVYTISIQKANLVALIMIAPITIIYGLPYYLIWGENILSKLKEISLPVFFLSIPVGIVLHEFLHGATWALFAKEGFKSIKFGIKWEYLTPYCHCTEPIKVRHYVIGGLMPLLIMGMVPAIWAIFTGNGLLMLIGTFFTWAAGGDIQAVWLLRKHSVNQWISDHPKELGFIVDDTKTVNKNNN
ncbi:MAG: DUF3267 domain-containing protein [Bacteroidales bacterium]|nr:DUF3267 domain-containing protein [Bacteroidales bacterium]